MDKTIKVPENEKKRIEGIDLLKAVSIIFIIITHFDWQENERVTALFPFYIDIAVPIFMTITGFNFFESFERNQSSIFKWQLKRLKRVLIPWIISLIVQIILLYINYGSLKPYIKILISGGVGPGGYYTIIILETIVVFPLLARLAKWNCGLLLVANLAFEIVVAITDFPGTVYRFSIFRYLGFIGAGMYFAKNDIRNFSIATKKMILSCLLFIGIGFIWLLNYTSINFWGLFEQWRTTSLPVLPLTLFYFLTITFFVKLHITVVEIISKASFHIMLFQMTWYYFVFKIIDIDNRFLLLILSMASCLVGGILFYYMEKKITLYIVKKHCESYS